MKNRLLLPSLLIIAALLFSCKESEPNANDTSNQDDSSPIPEGWQEAIPVHKESGCICAFDGKLPDSGVIYARPPAATEIETMVKNILDYAGLAPNFRVVEVDVNNAFATIEDGQRILGFGDRYLRSISTKAGTDWARLGVMAHEVGHHVQGHTTVSAKGSADSHRRELEADEYAGFICGLMGSSKEDSYAHTALFSERDSDSHPARSRRIEATSRGWLRAQHIRTNVKEGGACPVASLTGEGLEKRTYRGTIGNNDVTVNLTRSPDRSVFGNYQMKIKGEMKTYRFVGKGNRDGSRITLEEYYGCEPSATIYLTKKPSRNKEIWSGTMVEPQGEEFDVSMTRQKAKNPKVGKPDPDPQPSPQPTNYSKFQYLTALGGFPKKWVPVVSKNTSYTNQTFNQQKDFPATWLNESFKKGFRVTQVAGDSNSWAVVMSKGSGFGDQKVIGPGPLNPTRYANLRETGYRITALAGYQNSWVMVMSKNSDFGAQRFTKVGKFNTTWINQRMSEGYRITSIAGENTKDGKGSWMVVMSKGSGLGEQVYSDGKGFPKNWIAKRWNEGYRITGLSGYEDWRVVMSKGSGFTFQTYNNPSAEFPADFITSKWGKEHRPSDQEDQVDPAHTEDKLFLETWEQE